MSLDKENANIDSTENSGGLIADAFTRYGKALARAISRLVRPYDVEDVVQETYMRVYQAARKQPIRSPRAFMLKTARNIALNRLALADALNHVETPPASELGESNDEMDGVDALEVSDGNLTPDSILESEQEFVVFCRAVRGLPRRCRRAFLLRKVYGLSQREVAERMNVSEGTVEKHIAKAMFECMRYMQDNGHAEKLEWQPDSRRSGAAP